MLDYFKNHHSRKISGASILILVDNASNSYEMKLIDLSSSVEFSDLNERDTGMILGITNLLRFLKEL